MVDDLRGHVRGPLGRPALARSDVTHDQWVAAKSGEQVGVGVAPWGQDEAGGFERGDQCQSG